MTPSPDIPPIGPDDARRLLSVAREAAEQWVRDGLRPGPVADRTPPLNERRGLFVTLRVDGRLRGCMGAFDPDEPLAELLPRMTFTSLNDPRFVDTPIRPGELERLQIELSILTPMWPTRDPLAELTVGTHGVYVRMAGRAGCFLPQVAAEQGWDARRTLTECCRGKAGLPPDAWKDPAAEVFLFTAQIIREESAAR